MGKGSVVSFSGIKVAVDRFKTWKVTFLAIMTLGNLLLCFFFYFTSISHNFIMNWVLMIQIKKNCWW